MLTVYNTWVTFLSTVTIIILLRTYFYVFSVQIGVYKCIFFCCCPFVFKLTYRYCFRYTKCLM